MPLLLEAGDSPLRAKVSNPAASVRNGDGGGGWQVGLSAGKAHRWMAGDLSPVPCNVMSTLDAFFVS